MLFRTSTDTLSCQKVPSRPPLGQLHQRQAAHLGDRGRRRSLARCWWGVSGAAAWEEVWGFLKRRNRHHATQLLGVRPRERNTCAREHLRPGARWLHSRKPERKHGTEAHRPASGQGKRARPRSARTRAATRHAGGPGREDSPRAGVRRTGRHRAAPGTAGRMRSGGERVSGVGRGRRGARAEEQSSPGVMRTL